MVYLYDKAIVDDIREKINDDRVTITPYDNLTRSIGKSNNDKVKLPIISIERIGWSLPMEKRQHSMKFAGEPSQVTNNDEIVSVTALPIRIDYLLSVWTKRREDNDNIMRELIFYYSVNPTLKVTIPYGLDAEKNFNITFGTDIEDDSNIPEHPNIGEYIRQTIPFYVDDAYLWRSDKKDIVTIDLDGLYLDINNGNVVEKIGDQNVENNE